MIMVFKIEKPGTPREGPPSLSKNPIEPLPSRRKQHGCQIWERDTVAMPRERLHHAAAREALMLGCRAPATLLGRRPRRVCQTTATLGHRALVLSHRAHTRVITEPPRRSPLQLVVEYTPRSHLRIFMGGRGRERKSRSVGEIPLERVAGGSSSTWSPFTSEHVVQWAPPIRHFEEAYVGEGVWYRGCLI
jgi:hypothetical protein